MSLDLMFATEDIIIDNKLDPFNTPSSRSTEVNDIHLQSISQMITEIIPINTRILISCAIKKSFPFWVSWKPNENWDNKWWEFPTGGRATWDQVLASEEINKCKRARVTIMDPGRKCNHLRKLISNRVHKHNLN